MKYTKKQFKGKSTQEIKEMVTQIVVDGLNNDICPWLKPWASAEIGGTPKNYNSKREYHASNKLILTTVMMSKGYKHNLWVTYKGAKDLGGQVKKGQKGYPVVFWKFIEKTVTNDDGSTTDKKIPFLRYFTVFNIDQCEDIKMPEVKKAKKVSKLKPLKDAEALVREYEEREKGLTIKIQNSDRAYFQPSSDLIVCPEMRQFVDKAKEVGQTVNDGKQHYYSTLFHEMGHSTGTKERCNRKGVAEFNFFGSHEYSREELVAEISSAMLGFKTGLTSERLIENTSAYCKSWARKLEDQPELIVWAGGQAERAVKYICDEK